jgi:hypothetical protein
LNHLSDINLGDYLRACVKMGAAPETRVAIARMLGLAATEHLQIEAQHAALESAMHQQKPLLTPNTVSPVPAHVDIPTLPFIAPTTEKKTDPEDDVPEIPAHLTQLDQVRTDASIEELDNLPTDTLAGAVPEISPLFAPRQTRAILSRALSRLARTGPLNLDRIMRQCARRDVLRELPRLNQRVLSFGVQLLVDRGDSMTVFAEDQLKLEAAIRALVGTNKIKVLSFEGFPSRAGSGGKRRWQLYENLMPPPGTVVALLTDLGIGHASWLASPPSPRHWRAFADRLRRRACPVVAFVPYPPSRWPRDLKQVITFIQWDRSTRISLIGSSGRDLRAEN